MRIGQKIIVNIPDYTGGGIYALIDADDCYYVGSSKNIAQRVKSHNSHMILELRHGYDGFLNPKLRKAVHEGKTFYCEILAYFNEDMTPSERRAIEKIYINKHGGLSNSYNCANI